MTYQQGTRNDGATKLADRKARKCDGDEGMESTHFSALVTQKLRESRLTVGTALFTVDARTSLSEKNHSDERIGKMGTKLVPLAIVAVIGVSKRKLK